MDFKLKMNVLNLKRLALKEVIKAKNEDNDSIIKYIDEIIGTLAYFEELFGKVEEEIKELDEMIYYEFSKIIDKREDLLHLALTLKIDILKDVYDNNERFKYTHKDVIKELMDIENDVQECTLELKQKISILSSNVHDLKDLLKKEDIKEYKSLDELIFSIQKLYEDYKTIYDDIYEVQHCDYDYNDEDEDENGNYGVTEYDPDTYDVSLNEFDTNSFEINSPLNYDYSLIDYIYDILFDEIFDEQRILIGVIAADFYEYHKLNCDMYTKEDNGDILEVIDIIENSSYDDMVCLFNQDYKLAFFMIDSFLYYNLNYTPEERLANRKVLKDKGKLNVLKTHNKFIDDTLNDETIYNTFITTLPDLIRESTDSIILQFQIFIEYEDTCELLFKYFTTDFIPDDIFGIIPKQLSSINIKELKKLQLNFILSDYLTKELNRNNNNIYKVLECSPKQIRDIFVNNRNTLKSILKDYIKNGDIDNINAINKNKINICKDDRQKIYKINALTRLDI